MVARTVMLAISGFMALFVLFFCFANFQPVSFTAFGSQQQVPLGMLIFAGLSIGALTGLSVSQMHASQVRKEARRLEWEAQDVKLAASLKSDREKQLEAKIATLETALKQALKKT